MNSKRKLLLTAWLFAYLTHAACGQSSKIIPAVKGDAFIFPVGVMMEARQYQMLYDVQVMRDSLIGAYERRIFVLEDAHRTDTAYVGLMERKTTSLEADLGKLRSQLSSLNSKGKLLSTLGVIVGAATTYIIVRKR